MSNLKELLDRGDINDYFHDLLGRRQQVVSPSRLNQMVEQARAMTGAGVCSDNDHCNFSLVMMHVKPIAEELVGERLDTNILAKISDFVFKNRAKRPIDSIPNLFKAVHHALKEAKLPMKKMAYPQSYLGVYVYPSYNIAKWMNSVKEIYVMSQKDNIEINKAFNSVTKGWDEREKEDFSYWMRFYKANDHQKYKMAQMKYYAPEVTDDQPEGRGYFVPMYNKQDLKANVPGIQSPVMPNMSGVGGSSQEDIERESRQAQEANERTNLISMLRNKIMGRLTSAEKLLSGDEGRELAGVELAKLLESLHSLKRNVLSLNVSAKTANDLIIREANRMQGEGLVKGARMMRVIAQDPLAALAPGGDMGGGMPPMPGDPAAMPGAEPPPEEAPNAMEVFKQRLRSGLQGAGDVYKDFEEEQAIKPEEAPLDMGTPEGAPEAIPEMPPEGEQPSEDVPPAQSSFDSEAAIIVEAQAEPAPVPEPPATPAAPGEPVAPAAPAAPGEPAIEVGDEDVKEKENIPSAEEDALDAALQNVTVDDVIRRLENLANIFKHREIARELGIVDMMMDRLGIAAYFPNLAEAMQKALEANQYSLTRIEDILNKVRGVAEGSETDLAPERKSLTPEGEKMQAGLEEITDKERERKERRQERREQKEDAEIAAETPEAPEAAAATEELKEPATVERAAPTPVR